jgi:hypothetical protein
MARQFEEELPEGLNESAQELKSAARRVEKDLRGAYLNRLYDRFPNVQKVDVDEAFRKAKKKFKKSDSSSESSLKNRMIKEMEKTLSHVNQSRRGTSRNLSCVGSIKHSLGKNMGEVIKRAEKILTGRERKAIQMCSEGKPVRKMAGELGVSFPTAWRMLNSAIDKIRISYGMKPRNLDIRKGKKKDR